MVLQPINFDALYQQHEQQQKENEEAAPERPQ
jgi:preprotein translocase subunit SecB